MKKTIIMYFLFLFLIYLIPSIVLSRTVIDISSGPQARTGKTPQKTITVYFKETGDKKTMNIEEYLLGVIAAEMPANFPLEALKAQAVASRSYALDKMVSGGKSYCSL